jgi:hypothetical protein
MERFFHIRTLPQLHGGASVLVEPHPHAPDRVLVKATLCSKDDPFCRKTGREQARAKRAVDMPLEQLPELLGMMHKHVRKHRCRKPSDMPTNVDYSFATKYFTPKVEQQAA